MVDPILANNPQHKKILTLSLSGNSAARAYKGCNWPTLWTNNSSHRNRFKWSSSAHPGKSRKGTISDSPWRSNHDKPTRTEKETARLEGQLLKSRAEQSARHERAHQFERNKHQTRWEINGEEY